MRLFTFLAVGASMAAMVTGTARAFDPIHPPRLAGSHAGAAGVRNATCHFGKNTPREFYILNGCKPPAPATK